MIASARIEVHLLGSPQVRRDLKIPHSISLKVRQTLDKAAEARSAQACDQTVNPEVLYQKAFDYLHLAQKRRLGQIALQRLGPYVFRSGSWVAKYVGLSANQSKRISAVIDRESERVVRGRQALTRKDKHWYGKLDRKRYRAKYAAHDRKYLQIGQPAGRNIKAIVERVLTSSQKAKWKALLGKPFRPTRLTYDTRLVHLD